MLECGDRVLVVCCDEHDMWRPGVAGQPFGQAKAGQARHLNIEEDHVGRKLADQAQRVQAIGSLGHDAQFRPDDGQLRLKVLEQVGFVVGDQGPGMVDGSFSFRGSIRRTVMPQG